MQERVTAVARHGGFFISDLNGRASLGKSGAGEGSAEHFIKRAVGKYKEKRAGCRDAGYRRRKSKAVVFRRREDRANGARG